MSQEQVREALMEKIREEISRLSTQIKEKFSTFIDSALKTSVGSEEGFIEDLLQIAGTASVPTKSDEALCSAILAIEKCASQVEILTALIEYAALLSRRAALFVQKDDTLFGWKARGFSGRFSDPDIKNYQIPLAQKTLFKAVSQSGEPYCGDGTEHSENESFFAKISDVRPETVAAFPLRTKKRTLAYLYCDSGPSGEIEEASVDAMVRVAGLAVELLALSSSETEEMPIGAEPSVEQAVTPEPTVEGPSPEDSQDAAAQEVIEVSEGEDSQEQRDVEEPQLQEPPAGDVPEDQDELLYSFDAQIAEAGEPESAEIVDEGQAETVETSAAVEAAQAEEAGAPTSEFSEDQEEAKRFARLLLSEIKLYNEQKVTVAQEESKVYERLQEDIDRSWEMYAERVSDQISEKRSLFYKELLDILAEGDEIVLGDCPYRA